jgi:hypothetical protein
MPGPLRCAAWLDELVPDDGTALRTLHDANDDRRCHDEYAVNRFKLAGRHVDASPRALTPECGAGKRSPRFKWVIRDRKLLGSDWCP